MSVLRVVLRPVRRLAATMRLRALIELSIRVRRAETLPLLTKIKLMVNVATFALGKFAVGAVRLPLPGGPVFVSRASGLIDATTVLDIWDAEMFPAQCAGRVVLDLGAHKGYYGAWALAQGAAAVVSCEPQSANFRLLERGRRANMRRVSWVVQRVAVGAAPGTARLFVSDESWAHSLYADMTGPAQSSKVATATEDVPVATLDDLLEMVTTQWPRREIVVKVNVEGAAGDVLLPTSVSRFSNVQEIHLDHEPGSPYHLTEVLDHLASAGLSVVQLQGRQLYCIRRRP